MENIMQNCGREEFDNGLISGRSLYLSLENIA